MPLSRRPAALLTSLFIGLTACGGGGGGDGGGTGGTSSTLGGTILVAPTAAVDSDSNDIFQARQGNYLPNNRRADAQPLRSPVLLAGTVNEPGVGPEGNNLAQGDIDDYFIVDLVAGQAVELEFSADPANSDLDLHLDSIDDVHTGTSDGFDTRYECVQASATARYYVKVRAFAGASIYNLKIGAPGSATGCTVTTTSTRSMPGQLIALARPVDATLASGVASRMQAAGILGAKLATQASAAAVPQLLQLPATAAARSAGLQTLSGRGVSKQFRPEADTSAAAAAPAVGSELRQYAKQLRATGAFAYVEPNWIAERTAIVGNFPPNDRSYGYQRWHYEQISLPAAMARITALNPSTPRPVVAVIDDGVVLDHPDLRPQMPTNGRAFISFNSEGDGNLPSGDNISGPGDQPVFHGTHVAGTVGAATYDGIGGAGTAPMAQILPLRVFPPQRGAASVDVINAMLYAAGLANNAGPDIGQRRADVINMSLGSDRACDAAYQDAITRVRNRGVIVVVAAGNSGRNNIGVTAPVGSPANCTGAIAVSALDARKQIAPYSNTGAQIRVAAPGGDASQSTTGTGLPDNVYSDIATFNGNTRVPNFGGMQGTSMASPHVAGVMALMRFVNPNITVAEVDTLLANGSLTDDLGAAGRDTRFGFGLINAAKAVEAALAAAGTPPNQPPGQVAASPSALDFGSLRTSATLELTDPTNTETVTSVLSNNQAVTVALTTGAGAGTGRYTVSVNRDSLPIGTTFARLTVNVTPVRTPALTVQVAVSKTAPGVSGGGDFGPIYVLLVDPNTLDVLDTVLAERTASGYSWSASVSLPQVAVVAGGDLDNDGLICQRGEPCGAYPVYEPGGVLSVIDVTGDRGDIDFQVAPLSGMSVLRAGGRAPVLRRTKVAP